MPNIPISALPTTTTVSPSAVLILEQNGITFQGTVLQVLTNVPPATGGSGSGSSVAPSITGPDKPPSSPSIYDDEFTATTLDSKWSVINGGGKTDRTITLDNSTTGFVYIDGPTPGSGNELYGIVQASPTVPFTVSAKIIMEQYWAAYNGPCLFIKGTSGILALFVMGRANPFPFVSGFGTGGNYVSDIAQVGYILSNILYYKAQYDGTNIKIWLSSSGHFASAPYYTEAATARVGTPNGIGFGFISQSNPCALSCDWLRVTTP